MDHTARANQAFWEREVAQAAGPFRYHTPGSNRYRTLSAYSR